MSFIRDPQTGRITGVRPKVIRTPHGTWSYVPNKKAAEAAQEDEDSMQPPEIPGGPALADQPAYLESDLSFGQSSNSEGSGIDFNMQKFDNLFGLGSGLSSGSGMGKFSLGTKRRRGRPRKSELGLF